MPPTTTVQQRGHRPLVPQPPPHTTPIMTSFTVTATTDNVATSALTCTPVDQPRLLPSDLDLVGKPIGLFYSISLQSDGQETTSLTAITMLEHHGMIYVPIGYTFGHCMFEMKEVKGGSPYGAGTYAGDGTRQVSEIELLQVFHQENILATITKKLKDAA
ncbi:NAD(P)H dehydrogenase (quinone) [Arachis hypogaea]|nr:NAD(P)H dehydrogenase (quinone) [Arachis hypogaea]